MNQEIKKLTQKTIYDIYKEKYPTIVEVISRAVDRGDTPKSIHKFMQKKLGKNSATAIHISLVAEYLLSNKN